MYGASEGQVIEVPHDPLISRQDPSGHLFLPSTHYELIQAIAVSLQDPSSHKNGDSSGQL
jgi:hypothetical protein